MNSELIIVMDRSGSMGTIEDDAVGGYNQFIADQKLLTGGEAKVTLVLFDNVVEVIHEEMPVQEVPKMTSLGVRGSTALLDAVGWTITEQSKRIKRQNWADKVILTVVTDGYENASKTFTKQEVKDLIANVEKEGKWEVMYLVANADAFSDAGSIGTVSTKTANFTASSGGIKSAMASASYSTQSYRSSGVCGQNLSDTVADNDVKFGVKK